METYNPLYTTVTVSDFKDSNYIKKLINLDIGLELALLTNLSEKIDSDLKNLKKEIANFCHCFDNFEIQKSSIRVHQPGGYMYYWYNRNKISGFEPLRDFFHHCCNLGFQHFVIHAPYGNLSVNEDVERCEYRKKLESLTPNANLEVEEIVASNKELNKKMGIRFYVNELFEALIEKQKAIPLLDVYECTGVKRTIQRLKGLTSKGFEVKTIHMHKEKHKFLTSDEFEQLIKSKFCGNLVNEGFIKADRSFEKFILTKSLDCVVSNDQSRTF